MKKRLALVWFANGKSPCRKEERKSEDNRGLDYETNISGL